MKDDSDDRKPVVAPEELELEESDHVVSLDNDRFLVSPSAIDSATEERVKSAAADPEEDAPEVSGPASVSDPEAARDRLQHALDASDASFGVEIIATTGDQGARHRIVTNDVSTAFEQLVVWYAQQVGAEVPVEEVISILLLESSLGRSIQTEALERVMSETGVSEEESIGKLLATLQSDR